MKKPSRKPGRPAGTPKTGGRQVGTPNRTNVRMRDRLEAQGFDFAAEIVKAFKDIDKLPRSATVLLPGLKLDYLLKLAPYFMQRLREESEETPKPPADPQQAALTGLPTGDLLSMLSSSTDPERGN